jgi:hypothetical protein
VKKIIIATVICATTGVSAATTTNTYGFVKAGYVMEDSTNSVNKAFRADADGTDDEAQSAFTSTNSRWGITANNGSKTSGKMEFDLDAVQASGVSTTQIRVRQSNLTYKMSENASITMGKKWTKFAGVHPFTYAHTRVGYTAGNTGFIQDGVDYTRTMGNTSFSLELTNSGDAAVNLVSGPIKTLHVGHKMGDHKLGLAYTMADFKHSDITDGADDSSATGTKVYWAGKFGSTSVNFEYTMGSNLGSIHTGAFGAAANEDDIKSTAMFLSAKHQMDGMSVFGSYGTTSMDTEDETADGGISKNTLMSLGFDKTLDTGLVAYVEHQAFTTGYYSATDDESTDGTGTTTELGMKYSF